MSQIKEVNDQILTGISKTDEFYEALWGKEDFTPELTITEPNDYNCGAICNQLEYVNAWVEELTGQDIDTMVDPYIDIVVYFFTGIKRFLGESTTQLLLRMRSLIVREGQQDGGWQSIVRGTPWDILNALSYYILRDLLYYIPNAVLTDLAVNGGFEDTIGSEWTILPSGDRTSGDQFLGTFCLDFSAFTSAAQTISVTAGTFILNAFVSPASDPVTETEIVRVSFQRDSDSYYFNTDTMAWQAADPLNSYSTEESGYNLLEMFVIADDSYDITITFTKVVDFYLDRVEFGEKLYPCFEILYAQQSNATSEFASLWESGTTPYDYAAFLDQSFLYEGDVGFYSDSYYQTFLDNIKASGVRAIWSREVRL